jgi:transcription antitermination factor NusG
LRRERILPLKGTVLVEEGQLVKAEEVVARTELPGPVKTLNVVNLLGIDPTQIDDFMLKKIGDKFEKGEVIAQNKPFLGLSFLQTRVIAEFDGTVDNVSNVTGQVILRHPPRLVEIHAYLDGKVVEVRPEEGVVVQAQASFIQGIFGIGGETSGELAVVVDGPHDVLHAENIKAEHQNKILVGGSLFTAKAFERAKEVGVRGVVVGGFHDSNLKDILGYDLGVAITGAEELGLTLVMTEGFGKINMADKTFELLRRCEGRKASMSGATQIRAGVIRPEIIIPGEGFAELEKKSADSTAGTQIGNVVRCIRDPFFGQLGKIKRMIPELQVVESETKVRVLEVEFTDGSTAIVPRANIEAIEE